jgi:hypothetical protein
LAAAEFAVAEGGRPGEFWLSGESNADDVGERDPILCILWHIGPMIKTPYCPFISFSLLICKEVIVSEFRTVLHKLSISAWKTVGVKNRELYLPLEKERNGNRITGRRRVRDHRPCKQLDTFRIWWNVISLAPTPTTMSVPVDP